MGFGGSAPASYSYGGNPAAYIPTGQPAADVNYQNIIAGLGGPAGQYPAVNPANYGYGQATGIFNQANPLVSQYFINPGTAQFAGDTASMGANQYLSQTLPYYSGVPGTLAGASGTALGLEPTLLANAQNPYYASLTGQAANNPYYGMALGGALQGAGIGSGTAAGAAGGSQYLSQLAPMLAQLGFGTGANIGALAPQAANYATQATAPAGGLQALGFQLGNNIAGAASPLQGWSSQILNTGFDPQSALYNRTNQQVMDAAQAANAAAGLGSSPYGASQVGSTLSNFNIDWQNQQLARQTQALGAADANQQAIANILAMAGGTTGGLESAAGTLYGQGGNLLGGAGSLYGQAFNAPVAGAQAAGGLLGQGFNLGSGATNLAATAGGLPSSAYMSNLSSVLPFLQAQSQAGLQGSAALGSLLSGAGGGYGTGLNIGNQMLAGTGQAAALPYSTNAMIGGNALSALSQLAGLNTGAANLGMSSYGLPQQILNDLQSYLGLGQAAQGYGLTGGQLGYNQLASGVGGTLAGTNALFGQSGLFPGALSSIGSGIGGLFGGGAGFAGGDYLAALAAGQAAAPAAASAADFLLPLALA